MVSAALAVAFFALFASIAAVELFSSPKKTGTTNSTQAVLNFLPLAAMGALLAGVASIYRQLRHAAGGARTELAAVIVSAAVGLLLLFVQPAADADDGAQALELGMAAAHVLLLPAAAATTFFLGVALVFAHVCAGGGAVAGDRPAQMLLTKIALGSTSALVGLIALSL